ncbi:MAG: secretin N-terminal domain-containing protein [Gammaproteobacteria bacterium]|nr:secretin N-terminal domain-containing protein [Gammaproteobacteria bacterium]MBU1481547.1 secretin N-terminal domain-containing protein [Gammaproteobacteria bacterium]
MKRVPGMFALLLLSACATSGNNNEAADRINREMDAAVAAPEAAKPEAVDQALLPPLAVPNAISGNKPLETKFDLSVNSTPAKQVFMAIVSGTRYSVLVNPDVSGNISLALKDVTVFDALEAIREMYGYDYKVDGTRIYIQPLTLQTRLYQVNYLTGRREGRSSVRVASGSVADVVQESSSSGQQTSGTETNRDSARITTTSNSDFWDDLTRALTAIVGNEKGRSVVISPMTGVIVVRAMPDELHNVAAYLKASQISVDRQVILEAKIVEVQLNESFQSGVNWAVFRNGANSGLSGGQISNGSSLSTLGGTVTNGILTSTPGTNMSAAVASALPSGAVAGTLFGLAFQTSNFAALLNFLETQGDVHVLSSPRIATLNNQKAVLKVGTDEFFVTKITGGSVTGASGSTSATFSAPTVETTAFFSGIMLDVTPKIDENNEIVLHVHPSVSKVGTVNKQISLGSTFGSYNLPVPSSTISETDSVVRARDGQIVAIGGLMRQAEASDESGLPMLPKSIFGQTSKITEKRELIILLKPTVVNSDSDWSDDIARSRDRMKSMSR